MPDEYLNLTAEESAALGYRRPRMNQRARRGADPEQDRAILMGVAIGLLFVAILAGLVPDRQHRDKPQVPLQSSVVQTSFLQTSQLPEEESTPTTSAPLPPSAPSTTQESHQYLPDGWVYANLQDDTTVVDASGCPVRVVHAGSRFFYSARHAVRSPLHPVVSEDGSFWAFAFFRHVPSSTYRIAARPEWMRAISLMQRIGQAIDSSQRLAQAPAPDWELSCIVERVPLYDAPVGTLIGVIEPRTGVYFSPQHTGCWSPIVSVDGSMRGFACLGRRAPDGSVVSPFEAPQERAVEETENQPAVAERNLQGVLAMTAKAPETDMSLFQRKDNTDVPEIEVQGEEATIPPPENSESSSAEERPQTRFKFAKKTWGQD